MYMYLDMVTYFSNFWQGGRHVDNVTDQVVTKLIEVVKKKNKGGIAIKPFQVSIWKKNQKTTLFVLKNWLLKDVLYACTVDIHAFYYR